MFYNELYVSGDQNAQVPAHLNFGKFMLDRLRRFKDEVALEHADTGEKLTYREFTQYAVDLAVSLADLGIGKDDVVAIGTEKRNIWLPTALAIVFTGATYTPYDIHCGKAVLKHQLSVAQPQYFICSKSFWKTYSEVLRNSKSIKLFISLDSDGPDSVISVKSLNEKHYDVENFEPALVKGQLDTAIILYSSGTTGMPKGIQLTHLNCILSSLPDDFIDESLKVVLTGGHWDHNYDTFMTYKFLAVGRKVVYVTGPNSQEFFKILKKFQVNIAFVIPVVVNWLSKTEEGEDCHLEALKIIYSRSAPLHVKIVEAVKQRFPRIKNIIQGYGMTEAGEPTSETWGSKGPKPGSVGRASPGTTLKIVDPKTREILGPNKHGEICIRGPVLMKGYIGVDPASYLDEHGFYKTGDLGYYDEDGYFYIVDRLKEIIKYCGFNVAPLELETILMLHPEVREVGVVGKPVPVIGEEPTAFVVRQPDSKVTEQELIDYVASEVSPYMQLRGGVTFISEIPKSPRGKILRRRLREMLINANSI